MASECNKSFSCDYMLLNPDLASLHDVVKILFSSDIGKRKFVDCPEGTRETFGRRWIIFVSILAQKLLQKVSKPLAVFGSGVEEWLNLLSSNGNIFRLVLNSITGKVIYPEKDSATFVSLIGNIDNRVKLDNNISREDRRYNAVLSAMASKVSYENKAYVESTVKNQWKMEFLEFYDLWNDYQEKATTQAIMLQDNELTVVAFRGTEAFDADAWSSDFDISWYELPGMGKVHGGFMKALGLQKNVGWPQEQADNKRETAYYAIRKKLKEILKKDDKAKFIVTGHSLGGALAILFPAILALHDEAWLLDRLEGIYTFGQPRVGDENFGEFVKGNFEKHNVRYYRFVYSFDMVPRLPYDDSTLMFKHFGSCVYYNSFYNGQVVREEPDKNYFSLLWLIPKFINACWELIRSFIIPYTKGPDYKEGGLLRLFRVIGLITAGVPAHCPQDYINATRLGSSDVFLPLTFSSNDQKTLKLS
ncbi:Fungal lipase-like domain containing [Olea europaea subsp. europaea]|uniref:Fungal lipase-like domain containing n=1 Tax=Olea europaea subsp. europaea TaxID=158383 RepID=A0A8S0TR07_OLEEU|nr:Fungal lipase-like domain containing [Olea europaea subsp. europaea]